MKRPAVVFIFFITSLFARSQRVQTIVPVQVVAGNAFQIQYIINDPAAFIELNPPQFENLQLISGPNYYKGNSLVKGKSQAIENITYTVVPLKAGMIRLNAVTARFKNNEEERTDEIDITVLPQPRASFNALSTYTDIGLYAPASKTDLDQLIKENLFIKTEVDKRVCFLGEAITATFKLYSRLQSTSEVINAPSLYGFSVTDILNINEAHQAVETINGKIFNTSVLRKLQLYPAQSGRLRIDEMQLQNTVEFNDSVTGKKVKLEKLMASNPVDIAVNPLPSNQPPGFTGAVGRFTISAEMPDTMIAVNGQAQLFVTITGKGNFIQFGPPLINFPEKFDVFDPLIVDELDKNSVPSEGMRKYSFHFTTDRTGEYAIPPITFSFFDPSSRKFKQLTTDSLKFGVMSANGRKKVSIGEQAVQDGKGFWMFAVGITMVLIMTFLFILPGKRSIAGRPPASLKTKYFQKLEDISYRKLADKQFYSEIQKLLGEVNREHRLTQPQKLEWQRLCNDCQLLAYSDISSGSEKEELQKRMADFLSRLEP